MTMAPHSGQDIIKSDDAQYVRPDAFNGTTVPTRPGVPGPLENSLVDRVTHKAPKVD